MSSPLSSASTYAQIKAAYLDNASYAENKSTAEAATFITACRMLMLNPSRTGHGKASMEFNLEMIQKQLQEARAWLIAVGSPSVVHPGFGNFRDYPPGSSWPDPSYP